MDLSYGRWCNGAVRVLCSVMPFAGHVAPFTGLVAELGARGHEVTVLTGSRHQQAFAAVGAATVPWTRAQDFDENDLAATFPELGRGGPLGVLANIEHLFIGTAAGQARDLGSLIERDRPDVIVSDVWCLGAAPAARRYSCQWATFAITPLAIPSRDLPPVGFGLAPGRGPVGRARDAVLGAAFRAVTARLERSYRRSMRQLAVPPLTLQQAQCSPWLVLAHGTPDLEPPRSDLPPQVHFIGRVAPAWSSPGAPPAAQPGRPLVVVTQGTFNTDPAALTLPAIEALRTRPVEVLVAGDPARWPAAVSLPPNTRVVPFLDFDGVLPQAAVFVTNGGWGGVLAALAAGTPLVVAGADLDKPEIAARVARAGVGVDLHTGRPGKDAVARAVDRILADPGFTRTAHALRDRLAALGGPPAAADLLETLVDTGGPVLRASEPWAVPERRPDS